jgi:hypothetical protein
MTGLKRLTAGHAGAKPPFLTGEKEARGVV